MIVGDLSLETIPRSRESGTVRPLLEQPHHLDVVATLDEVPL
ncbi:MAG TPA: hypothetical protein VFO14_09620 [Vicinamibacterales bacterium]|nr:hypothetical protein [Vicinamibacterales bacterium]